MSVKEGLRTMADSWAIAEQRVVVHCQLSGHSLPRVRVRVWVYVDDRRLMTPARLGLSFGLNTQN